MFFWNAGIRVFVVLALVFSSQALIPGIKGVFVTNKTLFKEDVASMLLILRIRFILKEDLNLNGDIGH